MKITVDRDAFLAQLQMVSRVASTRSAIQAVFDATSVENAQKILGKTALDLFDMR